MRDLAWFPQLDVYDTCRRLVLILGRTSRADTSRERLFISDFYLANPSLLHHVKMPKATRDTFRQLRLPRSDYVSYPPPPVLFEKMAGVQSEGFQNVVGRGLIEIESLRTGNVRLSSGGTSFFRTLTVSTEQEEHVLHFLTSSFLDVGREIGGLRAATGLRRIGL